MFTLNILECLPGFKLENTSDNYYQCNCNTESDVLYCSPDQTTILLKVKCVTQEYLQEYLHNMHMVQLACKFTVNPC